MPGIDPPATGKPRDPLWGAVRELEEVERVLAAGLAALNESPEVLARADPRGIGRRLQQLLLSVGEVLSMLDDARFGTSTLSHEPQLPME